MTFANWWTSKYGPETKDVTAQDFALMQDAYETGIRDEREACAKACETGFGGDAALVGRACAVKIRKLPNS